MVFAHPILRENNHMDEEKFLEEYFEICKRVWEDMEASGTWPWERDSQKSEDLVESEDNPKHI